MAPSLIKHDRDVMFLSQVQVPQKFYQRLSFGMSLLDEAFGGSDFPGVVRGSQIFFTGTPGAGKSTLVLQMAELLSRLGERVLYNIGEETRVQVKMRADRLGLIGSFAISQVQDVEQLIKTCEEQNVTVLFQDSLQTLRDGQLEGPSRLKSVIKKLQAWKEKSETTLFVVGHVTKGGTFAGPNELLHDVDAHVHLTVGTGGTRQLELKKNRMGPASIPLELGMGPAGLKFDRPATEVDDEDPRTSVGDKKAERRQKVIDIIRQEMLEGRPVSAYCSDRFTIGCSGSFWRGMLGLTVKELEQEGKNVVSFTKNGRAHFVVKEKV